MKIHLTLPAVLALLLLTAQVRADVPPLKPSALDQPPGLGPLPIAAAGVALSLAVGVAGFLVARRHSAALLATLALGAVVLVATAALAFRAARAEADRAELQAQYDRQRANWRPGGGRPPLPPPPPPRLGTFGEPVAAIAFAPTGSFPGSVPWAALVVNQGRDRHPGEPWR
jgi:ribose/xylose/arabinose/galactoside ABC-type transport system permease subunit